MQSNSRPDAAVADVAPGFDAGGDVAPDGSPADGDASTAPAALPEPWGTLARAWHARWVACDSDRGSTPEFFARVEDRSIADASLLASLRDPRLTPDETAARRCIDALQHTTCFNGVESWTTLQACKRFFRGSLAVGSPCGRLIPPFAGDPCEPPAACVSAIPGGCGVCRLQGPCIVDADCPARNVCAVDPTGTRHGCLAPASEGENCGGNSSPVGALCTAGLVCGSQGQCRPPAPLGGPCVNDYDCAANAFCNRTCQPLVGDGEPCPRLDGAGLPQGLGCAAGMLCFPDLRCHPFSDHEGAFCMPGSGGTDCGGDGRLGLYCDATTHTCRPVAVVANGACGPSAVCLHANTSRMCLQGVCADRAEPGEPCTRTCRSELVCVTDAMGRNPVCEVPLPGGAACMPGGLPCAGGACVAGRCSVTTPPICP